MRWLGSAITEWAARCVRERHPRSLPAAEGRADGDGLRFRSLRRMPGDVREKYEEETGGLAAQSTLTDLLSCCPPSSFYFSKQCAWVRPHFSVHVHAARLLSHSAIT